MAKHQHEVDILDWVGLSLSGLCAVHCLILPVALSLLSISQVGDHGFHLILAVILIPLGVVAFWRGYRRHRLAYIPALGALGLAFLVSGLLISPDQHLEKATAQSLPISMTVAGSFCLIIAHYLNWRQFRCKSCDDGPTQAE